MSLKSLAQHFEKLSYDDFLESISDVDIDQLEGLVAYLDDLYFNTDSSTFPDNRYDELKNDLLKRNHFFKSRVGAKMRDDEKTVVLPYWMGGSDKIQYGRKEDETKLTKWLAKYDSMVVTEKLDGISCLFCMNEKGQVNLYTRGDGREGADVSYLKEFVQFPADLKDRVAIPFVVRGELIMKKSTFETKKYCEQYKNIRNMVTGLVKRKTIQNGLYDIDFVVYEIVQEGKSNEVKEHEKQLNRLSLLGFLTPRSQVFPSSKQISMGTLKSTLVMFKERSNYELDGIVCHWNGKYIRNSSGDPDYLFAFKFNESIQTTTVIKIVWNLSRRGVYKPIVHFEPVVFNGVCLQKATGNNAKYVFSNKLGKGAIIRVTRSNDVIPKIVEIVQPCVEPFETAASLPDRFKWNANHVDIELELGVNTFQIDRHSKKESADLEMTKQKAELSLSQMSHFFKALKIKFVGEQTVAKLQEKYHVHTVLNLLQLFKSNEAKTFTDLLGAKTAARAIQNITEGVTNASDAELVCAAGMLGHGVSNKKLELILNKIPDFLTRDVSTVAKKTELFESIRIPQIGSCTQEMLFENIETAQHFLQSVRALFPKTSNQPLFESKEEKQPLFECKEEKQPLLQCRENKNDDGSQAENTLLEGLTITMTGFRDQQLQNRIVKLGGSCSENVTKNTTILLCKDGDSSSTKVKKALSYGVKVMTKAQFEEEYFS
jgi:DNA ligase (NAD+)